MRVNPVSLNKKRRKKNWFSFITDNNFKLKIVTHQPRSVRGSMRKTNLILKTHFKFKQIVWINSWHRSSNYQREIIEEKCFCFLLKLFFWFYSINRLPHSFQFPDWCDDQNEIYFFLSSKFIKVKHTEAKRNILIRNSIYD